MSEPELQIDDRSFVIAAKWVAPMTMGRGTELIEDGAVAVRDGEIVFVGSRTAVLGATGDLDVIDVGDTLLMPGLVNAHTHLELSNVAPAPPPASFVEWILGIRARSKITPETLDAVVTDAVEIGVTQCLRFGVTTVGDISQHSHISRPLLRGGPIRTVSFGEVLGLGNFRSRFDELMPRALDRECESPFLTVGLSPHAPYTVDRPGYAKCVDEATRRRIPISTHLAETPDETPFLRDHAGPFRELWELLGQWEDSVETFKGGPIAMAKAVGLLDAHAALAHVNYCDDAEIDELARGNASVVYCPRTHAYFGHPPHRWREMLERGVNVALGTDSCASSPDLNLLDEARQLRRLAPGIPAARILEMATIRAATALTAGHLIGSLETGKRADFILFNINDAKPLDALLDRSLIPIAVWIDGRLIRTV